MTNITNGSEWMEEATFRPLVDFGFRVEILFEQLAQAKIALSTPHGCPPKAIVRKTETWRTQS
jgi:hypothetical protein